MIFRGNPDIITYELNPGRRSSMSSAFSFNQFGLGLFLAAIAAGSTPSALAEIRATGKNGLRTEVNGLRGGICNRGVCRIGGGTNAGRNKFHRFHNLLGP